MTDGTAATTADEGASCLGLDRKNADGLVAALAKDFLLLLLFFAIDGEVTVDTLATAEASRDFCGLPRRSLLRRLFATLPVTMVALTACTAPPTLATDTAATLGPTTTLATGKLDELLLLTLELLLLLLLLLPLDPSAASRAACSAATFALYAACSSRLKKRPPGPRLRLHAWR